ncbi:MAG: UbiA prenyltransferase family protein, partial [Bacteroidota bacterium]
MKTYLQLLRAKSWVKNGFLFLPAVFSLKLLDEQLMLHLILGFFVFSLSSSFIYLHNDLKDAPQDALHPRKQNRPIASGKVSKNNAFLISSFVLVAALVLFYISALPFSFLWIVVSYLTLNLLYVFWLKNVPLLELFVVAMNFVLRVLAGCAILAVTPSHWILVVTFFLSFLMVVVKRKAEIIQLDARAKDHRAVLASYSISFLNTLVYIAATITITAYLLYSIDPKVMQNLGSEYLIYSSLFVFLGIIRLIQISEMQLHEGEGDPT